MYLSKSLMQRFITILQSVKIQKKIMSYEVSAIHLANKSQILSSKYFRFGTMVAIIPIYLFKLSIKLSAYCNYQLKPILVPCTFFYCLRFYKIEEMKPNLTVISPTHCQNRTDEKFKHWSDAQLEYLLRLHSFCEVQPSIF